MSAELTVCAEVLRQTGAYPLIQLDVGGVDSRAWLYVGLTYLIAIPVRFLLMRRLLTGYPVPWNPLGKRWLLGIFSLILCSGLILLPVMVLAIGEHVAGRGKGFYQLFIGSPIGTFLMGSVLAYGAAMAAWLLLVGTVRLLFPQPPAR